MARQVWRGATCPERSLGVRFTKIVCPPALTSLLEGASPERRWLKRGLPSPRQVLVYGLVSTQDQDNLDWYRAQIEPHEALLRAWLQKKYGLKAEVDDIIQEVFIRALKTRERGALYSPKAFLFRAARNLAVDYFRKKSHFDDEFLADSEASNVIEFSDSIPEVVSRKQEYAMLKDAIDSLPDKCRVIFTMRRLYGMSYNEISEALGITRNTISAQLTIGLRKCAEYFEQREDSTVGESRSVVR